MPERLSKRELLARIEQSLATWEGLLARIPRSEWETPGFCGDWSLRHVLAHITWYEAQMVQLCATRSFDGSPLWALPVHDRNDAIHTEIEDLELTRVLARSAATHRDLLAVLAGLDDETLNDPAAFPGMPEEWRPWEVIASNTYEHYDGHIPHARAWLARGPE
jgi:hypothetical protein